ncbi:MAG: helix-turn-helix domain-containing protein [Dehalococcoidia bacterium]
MSNSQPSNRSTMLSISQASRMLGVSDPTLRQWTDGGQIKAFVTPGGHRRYDESELSRFMGTRNRVHGIKDLVARIELAPAREMEIAQARFAGTSWYDRLDADSRAQLAELGKRMHRLVVSYVAKPKKRDETLDLAREVGREFGIHLVKMGLPLTDALEAFLLHRSPLINAATDLMKKRGTLNERVAEAIPLVTQITDEALVSLVAAYQSYSGVSSSDGGGQAR